MTNSRAVFHVPTLNVKTQPRNSIHFQIRSLNALKRKRGVTRPWRRTLPNGSDVKYVFPRCPGGATPGASWWHMICSSGKGRGSLSMEHLASFRFDVLLSCSWNRLLMVSYLCTQVHCWMKVCLCPRCPKILDKTSRGSSVVCHPFFASGIILIYPI